MQYRLGYITAMDIPNNKWYMFLTNSTCLPWVGQDLRLMKTLSQNMFYYHSKKGKRFGQWILALNVPTRKWSWCLILCVKGVRLWCPVVQATIKFSEGEKFCLQIITQKYFFEFPTFSYTEFGLKIEISTLA